METSNRQRLADVKTTVRNDKGIPARYGKRVERGRKPSFRVWFYRPCYEYPYCRTLESVDEVERYLDGIEAIGAEVVEIEELT